MFPINRKSNFLLPIPSNKKKQFPSMSEKIFAFELETNRNPTQNQLETNRNPPPNQSQIGKSKRFLLFLKNHKKSVCFFSFLFFLLVIVLPIALYYIITSINKERYYNKNIILNTGIQNVSISLNAFYNGTSPFQEFLFINMTHTQNGTISRCENIIIKDKFNSSVSTLYRCGNDSDFKILNDSLMINMSNIATFSIFENDETTARSEGTRILHHDDDDEHNYGDEPSGPNNNNNGGSYNNNNGGSYNNNNNGGNYNNNGGSSGCSTLSGYGNFQYDSCSGDATVNGQGVATQVKGSCSCKCTQMTGNGAYSFTSCN